MNKLEKILENFKKHLFVALSGDESATAAFWTCQEVLILLQKGGVLADFESVNTVISDAYTASDDGEYVLVEDVMSDIEKMFVSDVFSEDVFNDLHKEAEVKADGGDLDAALLFDFCCEVE